MQFLTIQADYERYEIGLCENNSIIDSITEDKRYASRDLVISLESVLSRNNKNLSDISYIVANQGPGPFTSLRVIITTVNGLNFSTGIPLIGINSLEALLAEYPSEHISVAMLNAYNKDVYYAIQKDDKFVEENCKNYQLLLDDLQKKYPQQIIRFIGNAAEIYRDEIIKTLNSLAVIPHQLPHHASLAQFARMGAELYQKNKTEEQLKPIYLKSLTYKPII